MSRTRSLFVLPLTVLALGLTACGGGDDENKDASGRLGTAATGPTESTEDPTDTGGTDEPTEDLTKPAGLSDPEDALASWLVAYSAGESEEACSWQSKHYTDKLIRLSVDGGYVPSGSTCEETVAALLEVVKSNGGFNQFDVETDSETADRAELTVDYEGGNLEEGYIMRKIDGKWLVYDET